MSAANATTQSQTVTVFDSQEVNIGTFGTQTSTGSVTKSIYWNPANYSLVKAVATFTAGQSYLSGASAYFEIDSSQAGPNLGWGAFATGQRTQTLDVTTEISNGDNIFNCWYKINYGTISNESCTFSLVIDITLQYIGPVNTNGQPTASSTNPIGSGATTTSLTQQITKLFGSVENAAIWAVAIAVLAVGGYFALDLYSKGKFDSAIGGVKRAASKAKDAASKAYSKANSGTEA